MYLIGDEKAIGEKEAVRRLRDTFLYDPETGFFCRHGRPPVTPTDRGYLRIRFMGRKLYVHVLAWAHYHGAFPTTSVDHIDGDPLNNAIRNLRLATHQQNCCNRRVRADNSLGVKGVCWDKQHKKYRVQVRVGGKRAFQALYRDLEEAKAAYAEQSARLHGKFARSA